MNILVTGAWKNAREYITETESLGHNVVFMQNESESLPCAYDKVEAVICNGLFLHHPIEKFINLKYIQLTSAGYDRVPMDYVKKHGITIRNARGVYSIPMAEYAVCGALQIYKSSRFFAENQSAHTWEKNRGLRELFGKDVCILGCGSVGTECAERFAAFGCGVYGIDLCPYQSEAYDAMLPLEKLNEILHKVDILVITLPLTDQTYHLIEAERLGHMKPGSVLINISRGAVIDEQALISSLGKNLSGAVLDVFEEEPPKKTNPLWDTENVIITPHNSFVGDGNAERLATLIMNNLKQKE